MLPVQARPLFEEGVRHLFARWTALCLAIENQWGGATSAQKGEWLLQESVQWFYRNKGARTLVHARRSDRRHFKRDHCAAAEHYADDLEEELEDALLQDFNVEAEDGSPAEVSLGGGRSLVSGLSEHGLLLQVSKALVKLYQECLQGNFATVLQLREAAARAAAAPATARSKRQVVRASLS